MHLLFVVLGVSIAVWSLAMVVYVGASFAMLVDLLPAERGAQWFGLASMAVFWSAVGALLTFAGTCWTFVSRKRNG